MHMRFQSIPAAMLAALACGQLLAAPPSDLPLGKVKLPPGFVIELVARVPNARGMAWGERGTLFVGSASAGKVYALTLTERDAFVRVVASDLREPAGVTRPGGPPAADRHDPGTRYRRSDAGDDRVMIMQLWSRSGSDT